MKKIKLKHLKELTRDRYGEGVPFYCELDIEDAKFSKKLQKNKYKKVRKAYLNYLDTDKKPSKYYEELVQLLQKVTHNKIK